MIKSPPYLSGVEQFVDENKSVVSKSDLHGNITYCNPYFIEISGYSEQELLGAPHNILRHPDMPAAAFSDLWRTIKAGKQWTGLVKNRCKNGDHYWVRANVTPLQEQGKLVGYLSVRTKPQPSEVTAADQLYRQWQAGLASNIRLHHGYLRKTGLRDQFKAGWHLPVTTQLLLGLLGLSLTQALWFGYSVWTSGFSWVNAALMLVSAIMLASFWRLTSTKLLQTIAQALLSTRQLAGGDLSKTKIETGQHDADQLFQALQQVNINLTAMIGDVRNNVRSIAEGTREIAQGNGELSQRTIAQADSLQKTAASMSEFTSTIQQNRDNALLAKQMADSTSDMAHQASHMVGNLGSTMHDIRDAAKRIESITSMIDGIAFQTNILSLNAAVEAARAGEQGRGFAVVASEVRNLARRSATAAKEIKDLINDTVSQIHGSNQLVGQTRDLIEQLQTSVAQVGQAIHEISLATNEQSKGINEVNRAIHHIDEVTQKNTAMVEESAAAAIQLATQAMQLEQAISVFKMTPIASLKPRLYRPPQATQLDYRRAS